MADFKKIEHPDISNIFVLPTKEEASDFSANLIAEVVKEKPDSRITFATGNTQIPVYKSLAGICERKEVNFSGITVFHLDEYYPCKPTDDFGFVNYLYQNVFTPLKIDEERIFTINGLAESPENEAQRYETLLRESPIDLTILGIGPGGHIAFCESGTPFSSVTQVIDLAQETLHRDRVERGQNTPSQAITQGISTILASNKIILNAFDKEHGEFIKEALYKPVSEACPASSLRTVGHKVTIVLDQEAASVVAA